MKGKIGVRFLTVMLVISLVLLGVMPAYAAGAEEAASGLTVHLTFDEGGNWTATFEGTKIALDAAGLQALAGRFGFALPPLGVQPALVQQAMANDIQTLAIIKEGGQTTVIINGVPVVATTFSDEAVAALEKNFLPELAGVLEWLNRTNFSLVLHFPVAPGKSAYPLDLSQRLSPTVEKPTNVVELGLTLSPGGSLVSAAGFNAAQFGLAIPLLAPATLDQLKALGISSLGLDFSGAGVKVAANGKDWLSVAWNADYLFQNLPTISATLGFPLVEPTLSLAALAGDWLKDSQLSLAAYIAEQPQEGAAAIRLGRPLRLAIDEAGAVQVEGMSAGFALAEPMLGLTRQLGSAAVLWDGANGQLRLLVGGKQMPTVVISKGFLPAIGSAFAGNLLPWEKVDELLANSTLSLELVTAGAAPSEVATIAQPVAYVRPTAPLELPITVSRKDGKIAVAGETLPLAKLGMDISPLVLSYANLLGPGVSELDLNLGPGGLGLSLDGKYLTLAWDGTTRQNTLDLVFTLAPQFGASPALVGSPLVRGGTALLINSLSQFDVAATIKFTDEQLQPGALESLLGLFM